MGDDRFGSETIPAPGPVRPAALRGFIRRAGRTPGAGGIHIIRAGEDIRTAMSAADKEMYEEKRAYYARHPDRRTR